VSNRFRFFYPRIIAKNRVDLRASMSAKLVALARISEKTSRDGTMTEPQINNQALNIDELVERSGLSEATIWRLKNAEKIPFYQPGGKGSRVTFPPDALERNYSAQNPDEPSGNEPSSSSTINTGPKPDWMKKRPQYPLIS
jgi:predicted DNA-binding transcriptional regulator AlpA